MIKRILPHSVLPRQYGFLNRHAARSFITHYSYDFSDAAFYQTIAVSHGLEYAPIADVWVMFSDDLSGDAKRDYPSTPDGIYQAPLELYSEDDFYVPQEDSYGYSTDKTSVYINIKHISATTGSKHVYFHVKLYADDFLAPYFTPTETY